MGNALADWPRKARTADREPSGEQTYCVVVCFMMPTRMIAAHDIYVKPEVTLFTGVWLGKPNWRLCSEVYNDAQFSLIGRCWSNGSFELEFD